MGATFTKTIDMIVERLAAKPLVMQLNVGLEAAFSGMIDLLEMQYVTFEGDKGTEINEHEIPADMLDEAKAAREKMIEVAS